MDGATPVPSYCSRHLDELESTSPLPYRSHIRSLVLMPESCILCKDEGFNKRQSTRPTHCLAAKSPHHIPVGHAERAYDSHTEQFSHGDTCQAPQISSSSGQEERLSPGALEMQEMDSPGSHPAPATRKKCFYKLFTRHGILYRIFPATTLFCAPLAILTIPVSTGYDIIRAVKGHETHHCKEYATWRVNLVAGLTVMGTGATIVCISSIILLTTFCHAGVVSRKFVGKWVLGGIGVMALGALPFGFAFRICDGED